jgi:hypothetical protein
MTRLAVVELIPLRFGPETMAEVERSQAAQVNISDP